MTRRRRTAFVVQVHNPAGRPVSDLPISVGVRVGGKRADLRSTRSRRLSSPTSTRTCRWWRRGGTLTWVYTTDRRLPAHARPFALVGADPSAAGATVEHRSR